MDEPQNLPYYLLPARLDKRELTASGHPATSSQFDDGGSPRLRNVPRPLAVNRLSADVRGHLTNCPSTNCSRCRHWSFWSGYRLRPWRLTELESSCSQTTRSATWWVTRPISSCRRISKKSSKPCRLMTAGSRWLARAPRGSLSCDTNPA